MVTTRRLSTAGALAAGLVLLGIAFAACGGDGEPSVVGVIVGVEAPSLTSLESFTLRTNDGETLVFRVAPDAEDQEEGFFPSHLREHATLATQVEVFYREESGELLATRLVHRDR